MKITYEVEFDIMLVDGAKFPEPEFACALKTSLEEGAHGAFIKALCKVDDDLTETDKTPVADIWKWNGKVTEVVDGSVR